VTSCDVCGTDNDSKLTFCRNCGHRLKSNRSRAVPPTPATGMSKAAIPAEEPAAGGSGEADEAMSAKRSRPAAPPIAFGGTGRDEEQPTRRDRPQGAPVAEPSPAGPADKTQCSQCGAHSPRNYRFCISCGAVLKKPAPAPAPAQSPERAPEPAEAERQPTGTKRPAPSQSSAPRVPSAQAPEAPAGERICERCGGRCQAGEVFCKHCGAPLAAHGAASAPARQATVAGAVQPRPNRHATPHQPAAPQQAEPIDLSEEAAGGGPFPLAESAVYEEPPARAGATPERRAAAAKPEVTGRLVVIVEDGSEGKAIGLHGRQMDIGSAHGDIVLGEDRYLSPRHARFFRQGGDWYLRDLGSVNGVYRRLRQPVRLQNSDLVLLGLEVLQFELVDHGERGLGHAIQHGVLVFGSPATTRRARLCQRTVEGIVRDVYHLVADETTIGRETGDIVFTSDPFMSRRHAVITCDDESQEYVLSDLNSSNGTYVAIRDDVRLEDGDFIRLGQHLFRVDLPQRPKAR